MSVEVSGPLPRSLVVAVLSQPRRDGRRSRGWMRRRGLRPVPSQDRPFVGENGTDTLTIDTLAVDAAADFVQCHHPGCCALRPLEGDVECAVCGRR